MKLPKTLSYDNFIELTTTIFESNPLVKIGIICNINSLDHDLVITIKDDLGDWLLKSNVTITSISVRIPHFSIDDTVMIVDTGEIGTLDWYDSYDMRRSMTGSLQCVLENRLVKIPKSLLSKLQD